MSVREATYIIPRRSTRRGGFTLIELLIAVAIIAILASIAYPSYQRYVQDARRTDGRAGLMQAAQQLERCYTVQASYEGCDFTTDSPDGNYEISLVEASSSASTYTLQASTDLPDRCNSGLTLNHQGERKPRECW